jgi:Uncharacterized conserved protein
MCVLQSNVWEIYDALIAGISDTEYVEDFAVGLHWSYVASKNNMGVAMTYDNDFYLQKMPQNICGKSLKEVAMYVKSWDFVEATLGLAAINCYYNKVSLATEKKAGSAFTFHQQALVGKKVGMIGHFKGIEEQLANICELTVFERQMQSGDYPDTACEYLLPEQDIVILTASTLINKTFPRLLQLAKNAQVIMLGPSTPFASILHHFGVTYLSGFVVQNLEATKISIREGPHGSIFKYGIKINI